MPFGASISCAIFQAFSNALAHIMEWVLKSQYLTNYLDGFLFFAFLKAECDHMLKQFLNICQKIGCPVSLEKTEWATSIITFLGLLLDGRFLKISLLVDKCQRVLSLLKWAINKKKVTIKFVQTLTGMLKLLVKGCCSRENIH